jgi:hypothetical protein
MTAWDLDPNLYSSPYRALLEWARELLRRERERNERPSDAGCHDRA